MKKIIILSVFVNLLNLNMVSAQSSIVDTSLGNLKIMDGFYLRWHPYTLVFDTSFKYYVTYNEHEIDKYERLNSFTFTPIEQGYLKIFDISSNDTVLISQHFIALRDPEWQVFICGKRAGEILSKLDLELGFIRVDVENNDISSNIPITRINIEYYLNNEIKKVELKDARIPKEIGDEILKSKSKLVILKLQIKLGRSVKNLNPVVFYLDF